MSHRALIVGCAVAGPAIGLFLRRAGQHDRSPQCGCADQHTYPTRS